MNEENYNKEVWAWRLILLTPLAILLLIILLIMEVFTTTPRIKPNTLNEKLPIYTLVELKLDNLLFTDNWAHTNSDGKTLGDRSRLAGIQSTVGEVLAKDYCTIDKAVEAWMKSPTHKDIIVDKHQ